VRLVSYAIAVSLAVTSTASGAVGTWSTGRAGRTVRNDALVHIPSAVAAPLAAELEELEYRWLLLEATANQQDLEEGTRGVMGGVAHNARYRVSTVLKQVRGGVPIEKATCAGVGKARRGRFDHFRCSVLSARLEIPSPEAVWEHDRISEVRYGPPRVLGPVRARLDVRVASPSGVTFRQLGESSPAASG
jgi:hypothetical protein